MRILLSLLFIGGTSLLLSGCAPSLSNAGLDENTNISGIIDNAAGTVDQANEGTAARTGTDSNVNETDGHSTD